MAKRSDGKSNPSDNWIKFCVHLSVDGNPKPTAKVWVSINLSTGRINWAADVKDRLEPKLVKEVNQAIASMKDWAAASLASLNHPNKLPPANVVDGF